MDNIHDKWSLPWHALQKALAKNIHAETATGYAATLKTMKAQRTARISHPWSGRSRCRSGPPPL
jgi:hypothetical protein